MISSWFFRRGMCYHINFVKEKNSTQLRSTILDRRIDNHTHKCVIILMYVLLFYTYINLVGNLIDIKTKKDYKLDNVNFKVLKL